MPKKKENRGGARAGAGRPPKPPREYSEKFKNEFLRAIKKKAKATGKNIFDVALDMLYDKKCQAAVRASILKTIAEVMVVKETKNTGEVHKFDHGPGVLLPPTQERPKEADEREKDFKMGLN